MPKTLIARHLHVAQSDEQARAEAEPQLLKGFFGSDARPTSRSAAASSAS
jgi:hypothetical protein